MRLVVTTGCEALHYHTFHYHKCTLSFENILKNIAYLFLVQTLRWQRWGALPIQSLVGVSSFLILLISCIRYSSFSTAGENSPLKTNVLHQTDRSMSLPLLSYLVDARLDVLVVDRPALCAGGLGAWLGLEGYHLLSSYVRHLPRDNSPHPEGSEGTAARERRQ